MVTVPVRTQRQVGEPQVRPSTGEFRRTDTSDAFGGIGAKELQSNGKLLQEVSEREDRLLREKYTSRLLADVANFDLESTQDLNVLQKEAGPDTPFVKTAMERYNERSKSLLDNQPEFLKDEARKRLLVSGVKTAKAAMAIENERLENEVARNTEVFSTSLVNDVRFGNKDESLAMRQVDSYLERAVPTGMREAESLIMKQKVRQSSLLAQVETDPAAARDRIAAGDFNDVDPGFLEDAYGQASRELVRRRDAAIKLQTEALEERFDDPAGAASKLLLSRGVSAPTSAQLNAAQEDLQISPHQRKQITKRAAQPVADRFANVQSVDEFELLKVEVAERYKQEGKNPTRVIKEIQELADMPAALSSIFTVDESKVDMRFVESGIEVLKDPKAGAKALQSIAKRNPSRASTVQMRAKQGAMAAISERTSILGRSGMSTVDVNAQEDALYNMALVAYNNAEARGSRDPEGEVSAIFKSLNNQMVAKVDSRNAYLIPAELDTPQTSSKLSTIVADTSEAEDLFVPASFGRVPSLFRRQLQTQAGWVMGEGGNSLVLKLSDQPVFRETGDLGQPLEAVTLTFDELSAMEAGDPNADVLRDVQGRRGEFPTMDPLRQSVLE